MLEVIWRILYLLGAIVLWAFPSAIAVVAIVGTATSHQRGVSDGGLGIALPIAGMAFLLSSVSTAAMAVSWLRRGRRRESYSMARAVFAVVFGIWCLVMLVGREQVRDVPLWRVWMIIAVVSTVTAGLLAIAMTFASQHPNSEEKKEPYRPVRLAIERLPESERALMRADVDAAIGILRHRGLIEEDQAQRAWGVGLGKLAWYMSDEHERDTLG